MKWIKYEILKYLKHSITELEVNKKHIGIPGVLRKNDFFQN